MFDKKIIEEEKERLSFIQQLQEQITACRRLLSKAGMYKYDWYSLRAVEELETLLWAKIRNDKQYQERMKEINEWFDKGIKKADNQKDLSDSHKIKSIFWRKKAIAQFRELLLYIDKKNYMPIGEENV